MPQAPIRIGMVLLLTKPNRISFLKEAFSVQIPSYMVRDLTGPSVMWSLFTSQASSLNLDPHLPQMYTLSSLCFTHREVLVAPKLRCAI